MSSFVRFLLICLFAFPAQLALRADDCIRPVVTVAQDCNNKDKDKDSPAPSVVAPDWTGSYTARAAGFYRGTDSVSINPAQKLHIKMTLKDSSGNVYSMNVPNLDVVDGHFEGSGKINGIDIKVEGRVDCPAPGQPWKIRFVCNYCDVNGRAGRIIGIKDS